MADEDDIIQRIKLELETDQDLPGLAQFQNTMESAVSSIREAFNSSFKGIEASASEALYGIRNTATDAFDSVQRILNKNLGQESPFDKLRESAKSAFESIKEAAGGNDIGDNFKKLKEAGSEAFSAIKEIGSKGFGELKLAAVQNSDAIIKALAIAGAAVTAVGTALVIATKSAYSFVEAQSKIINSLGDLSDKTSSAIKDVSALETAFAHAGTSAGEFAAGYSKLADVVDKTWEKIKKDTQSGVDNLEQKSIAAKRASEQLTKLNDANSKLLQPEENPKPFIGEFTGQRNVSVPFDREKEIEQTLALKQAKIALREAERAETEARRNDLENVTKGVQSLIDGNNGALKSFNATADNIIKGVVAAAGQGSETLGKLGESFASVGSKAPEIKTVLEQLGLALKNIEDPALRTKVAFAALGPAGSGFLDAIDAGKLDQFTSGLDRVNNALTETDKKLASEFRAAVTGFGQDIDNIKNKLAGSFTGGFTDAIKTLDEFFVRISPNIRAVADVIGGSLSTALKIASTGFVILGESINVAIDIFKNMLGVIKSVLTLDFSGLKNHVLGLVDVAKGLLDIFKGIATLDLSQIKKGLQELSDARKKDQQDKEKADNDKTKAEKEKGKSNLPPEIEAELQAADARDAAKKRETERALKDADERDRARGIVPSKKPEGEASTGSLLKSLMGELISPSNGDSLPTTIGRLIQVQGQLQQGALDTDKTKQGEQPTEKRGILDTIKETFDSLLGKVHDFNSQNEKKITDPSGIGIRGDADVLEELKTAAAAAAEALNKLAVNANDNKDSSGDGGEAVAAADGGHIRGPGTSTSDSIPAMLSDGEFVVKKSAVDRIGVDTLNAINEERLRFAGGGDVSAKKNQELEYALNQNKKLREEEEEASRKAVEKAAQEKRVTKEDSEGEKEGPYVVKIPGGIPKSQKKLYESLNEASLAAGENDPNFVPIIYKALGGLVGGGRVRIGSKLPRFAEGGMVSIAPCLPRFAEGGIAVSAEAGGGGMSHLGTVDLTTNHGTVRVAVDGGGLSQLRRAAVQRNMGNSPKPSWAK